MTLAQRLDTLLNQRLSNEFARTLWDRFFELTTRPSAEFDSVISADMLPALHQFIVETCPITNTRLNNTADDLVATEFLGLYLSENDDEPVMISYIVDLKADNTFVISAHMLETEHYADAVCRYMK